MPVTINGSTGISGVDGSTGTPAIIGSDADTGLVFSAGFISAGLNGVQARVPAGYYYRLNADLVGANVTTAQSVFGVGVTLAASTVYQFDLHVLLTKTAGATSHTVSFGFAGTATLNNIIYGGAANWSSATYANGIISTPQSFDSTTAAAVVASNALANAGSSWRGYFRGTVSINAGGTFIPQYTLSAAPGGAYSTVAGSYISFTPIGAAGANVSVGTWS